MKISIFLLTILGLYRANVEASPKQQECLVLGAELENFSGQHGPSEKVLQTTWTDIVTKMGDYKPGFDRNVNTCSALSFARGCRAMRTTAQIDPQNNEIRITKTYAYNMITKNMLYYKARYRQTDPYYAVFKGEIIEMGYLNPSTHQVELIPINEAFQRVQSQEFAMVHRQEDDAYFVYQSCHEDPTERITWVQVSQEVVDAQKQSDWKSDMDEVLEELDPPVLRSDLADPEERFPFDIQIPIPTF